MSLFWMGLIDGVYEVQSPLRLCQRKDLFRGRLLGVLNQGLAVGVSEAEPTKGALVLPPNAHCEIGDFAVKPRIDTPVRHSNPT